MIKITLTIIQQLKLLGQILRTETKMSLLTSTRYMSPPTGEQPQRDRRGPFPNYVQEWIDPNKHFLENNIVPTRPRPSQFETSIYSQLLFSGPMMMMTITNRIGFCPVLLTLLTVVWVGGEILLLGKTTKTLDSSFGFLMRLVRLLYDINSISTVTSTSSSTISRLR